METLKQEVNRVKLYLEQVEVRGSSSVGHLFFALNKLDEIFNLISEMEKGEMDVDSSISRQN